MKRERLFLGLSIVLAFAGLLVTLLLVMQSFSQDPVAGCGAETGCAEVLGSRWSKVGPVPVSMLGLVVYLGVLLGLGARMGSRGYSVLGDRLLWVTPPLLMTAAIWFTGLQLFEIGAVCPFCMTSHGIGLTLGLLILLGVMRTTIANPKPPLFLGFLAGGAMIVFQAFLPGSVAPPQRAANPFVDRDGDAVIDGLRYVSVFGGELQFVLQDVPYLGEPDAKQVVVVLFDYACPHCQTLHELLADAIEQDPTRFVLVPIPLTIGHEHNPYLGSEDPRFEHSFERALLSLAVGEVDREKWKQFDAWLFNADGSGTFPQDHTKARVQAEQLIGSAALNDQLTGENIAKHESTLKRHIALLGLIPEDKRFIPVTTTPGAPEHLTTRYDDIKVLEALLQAAATED